MITDALLSLQKQIREAEQERERIRSKATRCTVSFDSIPGKSGDHSDIVLDSVIALDQINRHLLNLMTKRILGNRFLEQAIKAQDLAYTPTWDVMLMRYEDGFKIPQIMKELHLSKSYCNKLLHDGRTAVKQYETDHAGQAERAMDLRQYGIEA